MQGIENYPRNGKKLYCFSCVKKKLKTIISVGPLLTRKIHTHDSEEKKKKLVQISVW